MLMGVLLGVSVSLFLASGAFLTYGFISGFQQAAFTGAVIGSEGAISWAIIIFTLSLIALVFIVLIMRKPKTIEVTPESPQNFDALPR